MTHNTTRRGFLKTGLVAGVTGSILGLAPQLARAAEAATQAGTNAAPANPQGKGKPDWFGNEPAYFGDGRDWFFKKRFGLFTHWGIYSVAGYHEQHMYRKNKTTSRDQYARLMQEFNPVKFNPDAWLDLAEEAGMGYITFTTKHIDGFCMWDTKQTDYNITRTPYGKDVLAKLAEACHRRKFPLCLYYSFVDGHQPNYPNAGRPYEWPGPQSGDQPDIDRYFEFVKAQVRELCTNYGEIGGFWWDATVIKGYSNPSINALVRQLQPNAVINNRGFSSDGDYNTPERDWDNSVNTKLWFDKPTEACQAVGYQSWGYRPEEDYYTDAHLIRSIQKIFSKGGNYLLNVGPKPDGTIDADSAGILRRLGKWLRPVHESLFKVEPASRLTGNREVVLTRRDNTLYVHLVNPPETTSVFLHPLVELPRRATLLNTGETVACDVLDVPRLHQQKPDRCLRIKHLPVNDRPTAGWVVKLEFDKLPGATVSGKKVEETR